MVGLQLYTCMQTMKCCGIGVMFQSVFCLLEKSHGPCPGGSLFPLVLTVEGWVRISCCCCVSNKSIKALQGGNSQLSGKDNIDST